VSDLPAIPLGALMLGDAFETWWSAVRPSDARLLELREVELDTAILEARAAEDLGQATRCAEAVDRMRRASPAERKVAAGMAALALRQWGGKRAFVARLAAGDLTARFIAETGREMQLGRVAWFVLTFAAAIRHRPPLFVNGADLRRLIAAETGAAAPSADEPLANRLVAFFADRLPVEAPPPSWAEDLTAVRSRFGASIGTKIIRAARIEAYGDRLPKRGRPRLTNSSR